MTWHPEKSEPKVFWMTVPCPEWCDFRRDHSNRDDGEDRTHLGVRHRVVTTTMDVERSVADGQVHESDQPPYLAVFMLQDYREVEPRIWLGRNETRQGAYLTFAEAERLAAVLLDRVREARAT